MAAVEEVRATAGGHVAHEPRERLRDVGARRAIVERDANVRVGNSERRAQQRRHVLRVGARAGGGGEIAVVIDADDHGV